MKCPHCGNEINVGALLGSATSKAKTRAARKNAKLGGWPKGKKRGSRKGYHPNLDGPAEPIGLAMDANGNIDANKLAHSIVGKAEKLTQQGRPPRTLKVLPSPKAPKRAR